MYIIRRLIAVVPIILGVSVVVFVIVTVLPGDPAAALLGPEASQDEVDALRRALGLDQPVHIQYLKWLSLAVQGDLGQSVEYGLPVLELVAKSFVNSIILASAAVTIAAVTGVIAGVLSAARAGSRFDRVTMLLVLFTNSMPGYWLGLMLILVFAVWLGVLPSGGMSSLRGDGGFLDLPKYLLLPAVTLASFSIATVARTTRASLLEVLSQDYIRTARSKGLHERAVVFGHGLRNALLPVVTVVGLQAGYLLGGAVLTETVFSWPGLGLLLYQAIGSGDMPVIQGGILLGTFVFIFVNLVVDVLYAFLDPRVRYASE